MPSADRVTLAFVPALSSILRRPPTLLRPSLVKFRTATSSTRHTTIFTRPTHASAASPAPAAHATSVPPASDDSPVSTPLTFQDALRRLQEYWASKGCLVWHPYNVEVGAGTMNPATFLRVLGPEPWSVAYDEPSIRPDDSRYGDNPNRLQRHTQFQVIIKPAPDCAQELVVGSYRALGIDTRRHDVRFVEDNWESPALGAWGLGWEVWLDGMEVTQFTYFQQAGGMPLDSVAVEVTYGLERIIMALQSRTHFKDIAFTPSLTYGEIFMQNEVEMSKYNLDDADIARNKQFFDLYEAEAIALLEKSLPVPAYNYVLKASHTFNILDARGAIGVTERARYFQRMRNLARDVARLWVERREELGYPLAREEETPVTKIPQLPSTLVSERKDVADFVLEIGLEELPAADVSDTIAQVSKLLTGLLTDARLSYSSLDVNGTPRRISAFVRDLQTRQADETRRVRGPPLRAALADGKFTKAGAGFLRSQGAKEEDAELDETEGYMYATVHKTGRCTEEVLAELLCPNLIAKLTAGKSMRWNSSGITFSRPLRWLLCLLDDNVVPLEYANILSARTTRSLRGDDGFARDTEIASAGQYHNVLRNLQIVLSREERATHIREESKRLASKVGGFVPEDYIQGGLLEEVTDLVENPIPLVGRFDEKFLALPAEVLVTVMKKHQRYFPVVDEAGKLINAFITVANGDSNFVDIDAIQAGNEAVLRARYADAAFFYDKDTVDRKLSDFVSLLSGLTFQEDLGSMLDKKNRVRSSIDEVSKLMALNEAERSDAAQVADLYKADLATAMVVEMTSLAGIMGRHYAEKSGEVSPDISEGIFEASLPRFSGDAVAKSKAGAAVAVADRMDSLVGLFSVGLIPKSTADPFALRRAALGVVQTVVALDLDVDFGDLVAVASATLTDQTGKGVSLDTQQKVIEFIGKRLEGYLLDNARVPDDIVKAVLGVEQNGRNALAALTLCATISDLKANNSEQLASAQAAHSRAARLLNSLKDLSLAELVDAQVDPSLFEDKEEGALWEALQKTSVTEEGTYRDLLQRKVEQLANIRGEVDFFFDGVFVNAEDAAKRKNRLALCAKIVAISKDICDLTAILSS